MKRTQCAPGKMLFGEVLRIPQLRSRRVTASAAEAANPPERWMHSNQGERRPQRTRRTARILPAFECAPGELCSTLVRIHAAGVRLSLLGPTSGELGSIPGVGTPRGLFGEPGSILCSRSRIRGTGILHVSRQESVEKARNRIQ